MENKAAEPVRGEKNKRLFSNDPIKNEGTAAWADAERLMKETQVNVPSERNVINAKEWVDNGSRL
ncbi:CDIF630_02480 family spore surface protein [Cellulosilyticum sp. I15G10I2]|uniref:CDIF630_02480 family spore surface protein n=1 Tax=Cellulosilyticum sp. I15G10I2 TaxID=1892843 RepID=UPI00085CA3A0|nr:DUF3787 domain-containing protein [Cellulosilyticum sp. I15G10I2]